jgi:hypothetical protein
VGGGWRRRCCCGARIEPGCWVPGRRRRRRRRKIKERMTRRRMRNSKREPVRQMALEAEQYAGQRESGRGARRKP